MSKRENATANNNYKYEDYDVWAILNLRLQQENLNNVFIIPPIKNNNLTILSSQLIEEIEKNKDIPDRIILIPYNLGNNHWVGIYIQIENNKALDFTYYDSNLPKMSTPIAYLEISAKLKELYGEEINANMGVGLRQVDEASYGPLAIENLINAARGQVITGVTSSLGIREQHIELIEQFAPQYSFNMRQFYNIPNFTNSIIASSKKQQTDTLPERDKAILLKIKESCEFITKLFSEYGITEEMLTPDHSGYRAFFLLELAKAPSYWPEEFQHKEQISYTGIPEFLIRNNPVRYLWNTINNISSLVKQLSWDTKNRSLDTMFWSHLDFLDLSIIRNEPIIFEGIKKMLMDPAKGFMLVARSIDSILAGGEQQISKAEYTLFHQIAGYYYGKQAIKDITTRLIELNSHIDKEGLTIINKLAIVRIFHVIGEYLKSVHSSVLDLADIPDRVLFSGLRDIISHLVDGKLVDKFFTILNIENDIFSEMLPELKLIQIEFETLQKIVDSAGNLHDLYSYQQLDPNVPANNWGKLKAFLDFIKNLESSTNEKHLQSKSLRKTLKIIAQDEIQLSIDLPEQFPKNLEKFLDSFVTRTRDGSLKILSQEEFETECKRFNDELSALGQSDQEQVIKQIVNIYHTVNDLVQIFGTLDSTFLRPLTKLLGYVDKKSFSTELKKLVTSLQTKNIDEVQIQELSNTFQNYFTQKLSMLHWANDKVIGIQLLGQLSEILNSKFDSPEALNENLEKAFATLPEECLKRSDAQSLKQKLVYMYEQRQHIQEIGSVLMPYVAYENDLQSREQSFTKILKDLRGILKKDFDKKLDGFLKRIKDNNQLISNEILQQLKQKLVILYQAKDSLTSKELESKAITLLKGVGLLQYSEASAKSLNEINKGISIFKNEVMGGDGVFEKLSMTNGNTLQSGEQYDYNLVQELYEEFIKNLGTLGLNTIHLPYLAQTNLRLTNWYREDDIIDLLENIVGDFGTGEARVIAQTQFEHRDLLTANLTDAVGTVLATGISAVIPIHLHGNHWAAAIVRRQVDGIIQVIYNDSMGNSIQAEHNGATFVEIIQEIAPTANIIDLRLKQQHNSNDCGPFTVDNLIKLVRAVGLDNLSRDKIIEKHLLVMPRDGSAIDIRREHSEILPELMHSSSGTTFFVEKVFYKLANIPVESNQSKITRVSKEIETFLNLIQQVRDYFGIKHTVVSEIDEGEGWSEYARTDGKSSLLKNILNNYQMHHMPLTYNTIRKIIEDNANAQYAAELLIGLIADNLKCLVQKYPGLKKYFNQSNDIRNFFDHPEPTYSKYLIMKNGTTYISAEGAITQQIVYFSLHIKFIFEHILKNIILEDLLGVQLTTTSSTIIDDNIEEEAYDNIDDIIHEYMLKALASDVDKSTDNEDDNLGRGPCPHTFIPNVEEKTAVKYFELNSRALVLVGQYINTNEGINFIVNINANLSASKKNSIESIISKESKSIAAVITLSSNSPENDNSNIHSILYFAALGMDGRAHGILLNPLGNHLYDLSMKKIAERIINASGGMNQINIDIHNLGVQTDTTNSNAWVLCFLEQIGQLYHNSSIPNDTIIQYIPDFLRNLDIDISLKKEEYIKIVQEISEKYLSEQSLGQVRELLTLINLPENCISIVLDLSGNSSDDE